MMLQIPSDPLAEGRFLLFAHVLEVWLVALLLCVCFAEGTCDWRHEM